MNPPYPWIEKKLVEITGDGYLEKLPHALILTANPYWGVEELACRLTQKIVGLEDDPREVSHPDVLWLRPEDPKQKKERQEREVEDEPLEPHLLTLAIDDLRKASEFVYLSRLRASRKIVVLEAFEQAARPEGSNVLLKSIEEPPLNVHWILTTTTYDAILPTIRSRCRRIHMDTVDEEDIKTWLNAKDISEDRLKNLMIEFSGAPLALKNAIERKDESLREYLMKGWNDEKPDLATAAEFKNQDFNELLARWLRITARLMRQRPGTESFGFWDKLIEIRRAVQEHTNLNTQLQIERLLIEWFRAKKKIRERTATR